MENKWEIKLDVSEAEVKLLCEKLSVLAPTPQEHVVLYDLRAKIELAWEERRPRNRSDDSD